MKKLNLTIPVNVSIEYPEGVDIKISVDGKPVDAGDTNPNPDPDPDPDPKPEEGGEAKPDPNDTTAFASVIQLDASQPARKPFQGFGFSINTDTPYAQLTDQQRDTVDPLLFAGLRTKVARLWHVPGDGQRTVNAFLKTGIIDRLKRNGVTEILLAPETKDFGGAEAYAAKLWSDIAWMEQQGLRITATGIQNEPDSDDKRRAPIPNRDLAIGLCRSMLAERSKRGLDRISIIAPEYPSSDDHPDRFYDWIKGDGRSLEALRALAWHSYNMPLRRQLADRAFEADKELWQTEAGEGTLNGALPLDREPHVGAMASARLINDLNQGANVWSWFLGLGDGRPNDNRDTGQKLVLWQGGNSFTRQATYDHLRHVLTVVPYGTEFGKVKSSIGGHPELGFTFGVKTPITAAVGLRPDGRAVVLLANTTSGGGKVGGWGWQPARSHIPTFDFSDHTATFGRDVAFDIVRTGPLGAMKAEAPLLAKGGRLKLYARPMELVTAVSRNPVG